MQRPVLASLALASALLLAAASAHAEPAADQTKPGYVQLFGTALFGDGLRFNNPYRLATPLGATAESVSRTATYVDLGIAATLGSPLGFQHGLAVRASFATEGIQQAVIAPSYLLWRRWRGVAAYARAGLPIVLTPDTTFGLEGGLGAVWFVRGALGVTGELVGDLFYGAGTREVQTPAYPVLSAEVGLTIAYEVLP